MYRHNKLTTSKRGLTIIELLVAMAMSTVVVVGGFRALSFMDAQYAAQAALQDSKVVQRMIESEIRKDYIRQTNLTVDVSYGTGVEIGTQGATPSAPPSKVLYKNMCTPQIASLSDLDSSWVAAIQDELKAECADMPCTGMDLPVVIQEYYQDASGPITATYYYPDDIIKKRHYNQVFASTMCVTDESSSDGDDFVAVRVYTATIRKKWFKPAYVSVNNTQFFLPKEGTFTGVGVTHYVTPP